MRTSFNDLRLECVCVTTRWEICNYVSLSRARVHTHAHAHTHRKDKGENPSHIRCSDVCGRGFCLHCCLWAWLLSARAALSLAINVHQQLHQPSARHSHKRHQQHLKSNYRWQNEPSWLVSGDWGGGVGAAPLVSNYSQSENEPQDG